MATGGKNYHPGRKKCNIERSLNLSTNLPIIADTIEVTQRIGKRYLWVNSMFIQDSNADKVHFILKMDIIYGLSTVTIINSAGNSAFSMLPGIRTLTWFEVQEPFETNGVWTVWIMHTLDLFSSIDSSWLIIDRK